MPEVPAPPVEEAPEEAAAPEEGLFADPPAQTHDDPQAGPQRREVPSPGAGQPLGPADRDDPYTEEGGDYDPEVDTPPDPDLVANMERQQRKAFWKGEAQSERRLPVHTPRDPLAGLALQENERNEEALDAHQAAAEEARYAREESEWQMDLEEQYQSPHAKSWEGTVDASQQQLAQHALAMVNFKGGELSPAAHDDWVDFQANQSDDPEKWYKMPHWKTSSLFNAWIRDMEDIAQGIPPHMRFFKKQPPTPLEQKALDEQGAVQKARGLPEDRPNVPLDPGGRVNTEGKAVG